MSRRGAHASRRRHAAKGPRPPRRAAPLGAPPPPFVHAPVPRARIICVDNGVGLSRDRVILTGVLQSCGWDVEWAPPDVAAEGLAAVDAQFHIEVPAIHLFGHAQKNIVIPHPEFWDDGNWTPHLSHPSVEVWTKTRDAYALFRGCTVPRDVVRHIGWTSNDRYDPRVERQRVFLHVAGKSTRKGTVDLVESWRGEWPPLLVVVDRPLGVAHAQNVTILEGRLDDAQLRHIQNQCQFHICPSMYEGYGHTIWEGLSCGAVVLYPDAPPFVAGGVANLEGVLLATRAVRDVDRFIDDYRVGSDEILDGIEAALQLDEEDIADISGGARPRWEQSNADFRVALVAAIGSLRVSSDDTPPPSTIEETPRNLWVVTVHSPEERCGVAEYGAQLDRALEAAGLPVVATTLTDETAFEQAGPGVTYLVHAEPGLFPVHLAASLRRARSQGARVILCCHHFAPDFLVEFRHVTDLFVLHRTYEGLVDAKVVVIPLGCPSYHPPSLRVPLRERLGLPPRAIIVTTIGFLAAWKRVPDVVAALFRYWPRGLDVHLQLLTPLPFIGDSLGHEAELRRLVERSGRSVTFSTEFRSEEELLDRVAVSDFGFLYHPIDTGSVSAATKMFVSARCPVVVTGSTHASDLRGGVDRVEGFDLDTFARRVAALAGNVDQRDRLRIEMEAEYQRLNMANIAARYIALFRGV